MSDRRLQGRSRVHRGLHLPLDAVRRQKPVARRRTLSQVDRRMAVVPPLFITNALELLLEGVWEDVLVRWSQREADLHIVAYIKKALAQYIMVPI